MEAHVITIILYILKELSIKFIDLPPAVNLHSIFLTLGIKEIKNHDFSAVNGFASFIYYFLGYLTVYFKRKTLLAVFLIIWSVFTALSGMTKSYWQLALTRFGLGIG